MNIRTKALTSILLELQNKGFVSMREELYARMDDDLVGYCKDTRFIEDTFAAVIAVLMSEAPVIPDYKVWKYTQQGAYSLITHIIEYRRKYGYLVFI